MCQKEEDDDDEYAYNIFLKIFVLRKLLPITGIMENKFLFWYYIIRLATTAFFESVF